MKIGTALKTIIASLFFLLPFNCFAEDFNVNVTVSVNTDIHSYIEFVPPTTEILAPSLGQITMVDGNGNPKVGRKTFVYVKSSNGDKVTITQPSVTDSSGKATASIYASASGVYEVCIRDITEATHIEVEKCSNLYVIPTPPPVMQTEEPYTDGDSNTVSWTPQGSLTYQYYAEVSTDPDFTSVVNNSGWISSTSHTFTGLQGGQMYFYRVKARNEYGTESGWSNYVYSAQSVTPPTIMLEKITVPEDTYINSWNKDSTVTFIYRINDKLGVSSVKFLCVNGNGTKRDCNANISRQNNIYTVTLKLSSLEKQLDGSSLFPSYSFCMEATNVIGTKSSNCTATINFGKKSSGVVVDDTEEVIMPPDSPSLPIPQKPEHSESGVGIISYITGIAEKIVGSVISALTERTEEEARNIAITSLALSVPVGTALLTTFITSMPYLVTQIVLGILTLFGLRKKGVLNGYVYDSYSKEPIKQAIVRVFNKKKELIWTDVTNGHGYFKTIDVADGQYYIEVSANGYKFPTTTVFGSTDLPMENIYHGGLFSSSNNRIPKFSIPLDRAKSKKITVFKQRFLNLFKLLLHLVHIALFIVGLIFSIYAVYVSPTVINYIILSLYIPSILLIIWPIFSKREKYGIVRDEKGNRLEGINIGLFEVDFNRLILKRVSDKEGRYRFLADRGEYYISILNPEYSLVDKEKLANIVVKKETGEMIRPDITVQKNVKKD
ncbi:MAG: carboxypeptidase regulatory-like domain-containing protein [Candidatus Dojkabacteria bacterium]|mgnify:CR=1 FL=1|jgi:hypothetical protein